MAGGQGRRAVAAPLPFVRLSMVHARGPSANVERKHVPNHARDITGPGLLSFFQCRHSVDRWKTSGQTMKKFLPLLLLFCSAFTDAAVCTSTSWTASSQGVTGQGSSASAACIAWGAAYEAKYPGGNTFGQPGVAADGKPDCLWRDQPPGSTTPRSLAYVPVSGDATCTPPVPDAVCAPKTGQATTVNFTEGYTRTTAEGDRSSVGPVNTPPADGKMCSAGCAVSAQTSGPGVQYYVSATPTAQGLYRRSVDFPAQHLGQTCNAGSGGSTNSDAPVNPDVPSPQCPGFVGEVNGVPGCFGTAQSPVSTTSMPRPTTSPPAAGNPSAGDKPTTGEGAGTGGTGRTPSAGSGGNAGGPASAANGPKGTINKPSENEVQAECGAPGQPKCSIDESGTPDGKDALSGKLEDLDAKLGERETALTTVTSATGKDTSWGVMPKWTEQGTCSVWNIFTLPPSLGSRVVSLDLCPVMPYAHGVANFIWCALAFVGITSMVFAAMTSKGT